MLCRDCAEMFGSEVPADADGACARCGGLMDALRRADLADALETQLAADSLPPFEDAAFGLGLALPRTLELRARVSGADPGTSQYKARLREILAPKLEAGLGPQLRGKRCVAYDRADLSFTMTVATSVVDAEVRRLVDADRVADVRRGQRGGLTMTQSRRDPVERQLTVIVKAWHRGDWAAVLKQVLSLDDDLLRQVVPECPAATCVAAEVEWAVRRESVFVGGRYSKYSREMLQTPMSRQWAKVPALSSFLAGPLRALMPSNGVRFYSSGREDLDVRMLGGRPFIFEVLSPRALSVPVDQYVAAVHEGCGGVVAVRDVRTFSRAEVDALRACEADKEKTYTAVVWTSVPVTAEQRQALCDRLSGCQIAQGTPVRVIHRRAAMTRARTVYTASARPLSPHTFLLDLRTEAGTYIKELVHGDLGRTKPSVASILGCRADIVQLDVRDVHVP